MNQHPCQDKCPNFTDENCCHCLVQIKEDSNIRTSDEQKFLDLAIEAEKEIS